MRQVNHNWDTEVSEDMKNSKGAHRHEWCIEIYKRNTEMYKLVSEHFRQDLREFWSRIGMYMLSQAFLFAAFAALVVQSRVGHPHDVIFEVTLGAVGIMLALIGFLVAKSSADWIHKWRDQMLEIDKIIDGTHSYCEVERPEKNYKDWLKWLNWLNAPGPEEPPDSKTFWHDPVKLTKYTPLVLLFGWLVMTLTVIFAARFPQWLGGN